MRERLETHEVLSKLLRACLEAKQHRQIQIQSYKKLKLETMPRITAQEWPISDDKEGCFAALCVDSGTCECRLPLTTEESTSHHYVLPLAVLSMIQAHTF